MSHICPHCKQNVDMFEGIFDEYIWYHTHCYHLIKSKRKDKLQKKVEGKTITLEEAEELAELTTIVQNTKKYINTPSITSKEIFSESKPRLFDRSVGLERLDQHKQELQKHKRLEAARSDKIEKISPKKNKMFETIRDAKH